MRYLTLIFLLFAVWGASAQKLPNKQQASVWAPANVKIDGRTNEWNVYFQAHNSATDLFYTIANDDKNLYFVFHADDASTIFNKIITGGLTVVFKSDSQTQSITYPYYLRKDIPSFKRISPREVYPIGTTPEWFQDSVNKANTLKLTAAAKEIIVTGFQGLDTLISVYNEYGIKAAGAFDGKSAYTCEIAIPLKYIKLDHAKNNINLQVTVNGGINKYVPDKALLYDGTNADGSPLSRAELDKMENAMNIARMARYATTDFSCQYTLAKAP